MLPGIRSRRLWIGIGIFILSIALAQWAPQWFAIVMGKPYVPCGETDKACAVKAISDHAVKRLGYWQNALSRPLEERIGAGTPELVAYVTLENIQGAIPNRPRAAKLAPDFMRDVHEALAELPRQIRVPLAAKLAGIYFIEDIGSTGFTDHVVDASGKPVAGFIVLDPTTLDRSANAWATWKEGTPFTSAPGVRLEAVIESEAQNNRKNAIQYILLHELGHIFSIGATVHPSWATPPEKVRPADYPFFLLAWTHSPDGRQYVSVFDAQFPQRKNVAYYSRAPARLDATRMLEVYGALERTSFATLYAATNPFDDFAEAFASYVHAELMGKPWEIRIHHDAGPARTFRLCWGQPRCRERQAILDGMLSR